MCIRDSSSGVQTRQDRASRATRLSQTKLSGRNITETAPVVSNPNYKPWQYDPSGHKPLEQIKNGEDAGWRAAGVYSSKEAKDRDAAQWEKLKQDLTPQELDSTSTMMGIQPGIKRTQVPASALSRGTTLVQSRRGMGIGGNTRIPSQIGTSSSRLHPSYRPPEFEIDAALQPNTTFGRTSMGLKAGTQPRLMRNPATPGGSRNQMSTALPKSGQSVGGTATPTPQPSPVIGQAINTAASLHPAVRAALTAGQMWSASR